MSNLPKIHKKVSLARHAACLRRSLTNSVYLTLRQRWTRGAVVHGVR
jgi:hypothetical protein